MWSNTFLLVLIVAVQQVLHTNARHTPLHSSFGEPNAPPYPQPRAVESQEESDGYSFPAHEHDIASVLYGQMWYFNWYDKANDIAGVIGYGVDNPNHADFVESAALTFGMVVSPHPEVPKFNVFSKYYRPDKGQFKASKTFAPNGTGQALWLPPGHITVITNDTYKLQGNATNGTHTVSWDLTYTRAFGDPGWYPWRQWPLPKVFDLFNTWIDYYMQMPNAVVNGQVRMQYPGGSYSHDIHNASGYHDGMKGEFVFPQIAWDWADYKQEEDQFAVQMLWTHEPVYSCKDNWETCAPGNVRVFWRGKAYNFVRGADAAACQVQVHYNHTFVDPVYHKNVPDIETIDAHDAAGNVLSVQWKLLAYETVYYPVPKPLTPQVTYEIMATFSGWFYEASSQQKLIISGRGWSDYSGAAQ